MKQINKGEWVARSINRKKMMVIRSAQIHQKIGTCVGYLAPQFNMIMAKLLQAAFPLLHQFPLVHWSFNIYPPPL